jgi:hypothetical protein
VLTLDRANIHTQGLSGANHLDIAVSVAADPTGAWNVYSLPVPDDGTQGTPDHHCTLGNNPAHGPCLGDYPHIGADASGFYITTTSLTSFPLASAARRFMPFPKLSWPLAHPQSTSFSSTPPIQP